MCRTKALMFGSYSFVTHKVQLWDWAGCQWTRGSPPVVGYPPSPTEHPTIAPLTLVNRQARAPGSRVESQASKVLLDGAVREAAASGHCEFAPVHTPMVGNTPSRAPGPKCIFFLTLCCLIMLFILYEVYGNLYVIPPLSPNLFTPFLRCALAVQNSATKTAVGLLPGHEFNGTHIS